MGAARKGADRVPVGVVVVGHGRIAAEMVDTLQSVVGDVDAVEGVACTPSEGPEVIRTRVGEAIERVERGAGVIVLTDMLGDTASNVSLQLASRRSHVEVVAGVNMPMLVKLTTSRYDAGAHELANFIRRYGQDHIFWPTGTTP